MAEEKKKPEEEEKKVSEPEDKKNEPKPEDKPKDDKPDESEKQEEKPASDDKQADENGEGADKSEEDKPEEKQEDKSTEDNAPEAPQLSEIDALKAENLTLKTQLEAMKIGFNPDCLDDAVVLAEAIVKRDGTDISAALQAVAKKYPDWKADGKDGKSKGGFKVGADNSEKEKKTDDDKLNSAFGIKKKK